MAEIDQLMLVVRAFGDATGQAESTVSTKCFGAGSRVRQLREGSDMGSRRIARALDQLSAEWPPGAPWPADVPRPKAEVTP